MAEMNKRTSVMILVTVLGLLAAAPALAVKGGLYLGAGVGGAVTKWDQGDQDFSESDAAWKLFVGYHFLQFFAVEAAYRDLGSPTESLANRELKLETTAFDLSGTVGVPLGPVYLFGKAGIAYWDSEFSSSNNMKLTDDGTSYLAGVGLSVDIFKIQLRAEAEYLDAADGAAMYSVGAAWRF